MEFMPTLTTRVYEITIIIYAASVLLYFIDYLQNDKKANRLAFSLLFVVWMLQTFFLSSRVAETGRFPILTIFEGMYFYAWILITFSLIINRLLRVDFIVFFTNVLGFFIMALHTFAPIQHTSRLVAEQLVSELLIIHITLAILAYGAFSFSFMFSALYMVQYRLLKQKKWGKRLLRINDLTSLERAAHMLNVIGLPIFLISVILGFIWANLKVPTFVVYDAKILGSFIVIGVYSFYFYMKIGQNMYGKQIAVWNIGAFLSVLINFFLFGRLSDFHLWYS